MRFSPVSPKYLANSYTALVLARIVHSIHLQSLVNTGLQPGGWSLDIPHANGVRAHQPRATPWETSLQWHRPPWKGGGSFRGLRPFRAPECSGGGPGFPGSYPGLICWRASSACSCGNGLEARMSKLQAPGFSPVVFAGSAKQPFRRLSPASHKPLKRFSMPNDAPAPG